MAKTPLRVMIVDDKQIVIDGLTLLLKIFEDLNFVGSAKKR